MMRHLLVTTLLSIMTMPLSGQDPFSPIQFEGIDHQWTHMFVDSSRIDTDLSEGTQYLGDTEVYPVGDSIAYFIFRDRADRYSGVFIEKLDLNTGESLWKSKFDKRETGFRELPTYFGITEDGRLELVSYKEAGDPGPFGTWNNGHFLRRELDPGTGEELEIFYNPDYQEEEEMFIFGTVSMLKHGDNFLYFRQYYKDNEDSADEIIHNFKQFSENSSLLSDDSVALPLPNPGYLWSSLHTISEELVNLMHTSPGLSEMEDLREIDPDDFDVVLNFFDNDLQHTSSVNTTDDLPAKWHSVIWKTYDDLILIRSLDSAYLQPYNIDPDVYFSVFDKSGTHLSDIHFGKQITLSGIITPVRIPNTNDFVFFQLVRDFPTANKSIEVWLLEEGGEASLTNTLEFEDERDIRLTYRIQILENRDALFYYTGQTRGPGGASENYHNMVMRLSADDLGLGTSSVTDYSREELPIHVFPNPFSDEVFAQFEESISGQYAVYDILGNLVADGSLNGESELRLDASSWPVGTYVLSINSESRGWTGKIIKMQ